MTTVVNVTPSGWLGAMFEITTPNAVVITLTYHGDFACLRDKVTAGKDYRWYSVGPTGTRNLSWSKGDTIVWCYAKYTECEHTERNHTVERGIAVPLDKMLTAFAEAEVDSMRRPHA